MLLREEFYLDGLNCHPETFDLECELLNQQHHKNNTYDEIKSHHYIISHLDIANMELLGDGITPMHTTFETNKEKIRNAISDIAERATSFEEW